MAETGKKRTLETLVANVRRRQKRDKDGGSRFDVTGLLTCCLEAHNFSEYHAALAGPVNHFPSQTADRGWGCGWRNMQIMASYLLQRDQASADALFQGCGFVPDIPTLQAWLECAWKAGIDTAGGDLLGNTIQGSKHWIGTTECATVLRLSGFKAQVVDFTGGLKNPNIQTDNYGEDVHEGVECDHCRVCPIVGPRYCSEVISDFDLCKTCYSLPDCQALAPFRTIQRMTEEHAAPHEKSGATQDHDLADRNQQNRPPHERLMQWVWSHFTQGSGFDDHNGAAAGQDGACDENAPQSSSAALRQSNGSNSRTSSSKQGQQQQHVPAATAVFKSSNSPLYFQHEGHSRTIIGIERYRQKDASEHVYNLLVLDPSIKSEIIEAKLKQGKGWQGLIKEGADGLAKAQYQLLYVQSGLIQVEDKGDWDLMTAIETY